jgi:hypothetical protein
MNIFKHDCNKHGHRFEARYDDEMADSIVDLIQKIKDCDELTKRMVLVGAMTLKKYHYDICTRCGKIIKDKEKKCQTT